MSDEKPAGAPPSDPEAAAAEAAILDLLAELGVTPTITRHPPLFTVEDSQALRGELPGAHIKNMFMKDKKGGFWLVTCLEERKIRIKDLEKALGAPRMSFGKPDLLWEVLGVRPGAVTPLALMTDREARQVRMVLDKQMLDSEVINAHPLHNEATLTFPTADLKRFVAACGHSPEIIDFDALEQLAAAES